jgi:hypothetical protein
MSIWRRTIPRSIPPREGNRDAVPESRSGRLIQDQSVAYKAEGAMDFHSTLYARVPCSVSLFSFLRRIRRVLQEISCD